MAVFSTSEAMESFVDGKRLPANREGLKGELKFGVPDAISTTPSERADRNPENQEAPLPDASLLWLYGWRP
jgi:hypothetical protein